MSHQGVLVLNAGSSSLKLQLFAMPAEQRLAKGLFERLGEEGARFELSAGQQKWGDTRPLPDVAAALSLALAELRGRGLLEGWTLSTVGHRVVHGGERFTAPAAVDEEVRAAIAEHARLAPLHNPANLEGIEQAQRVFPDALHVAVFDTAFHQTMPERAYLYGLPWRAYAKHGIRRYGFHGTSHAYVSARAAVLLGRPLAALKLVSLHLGNGCSAAAIDGGRSVDTSLGLTPLEGLVMGTRVGDVDPGALCSLARAEGLGLDALEQLLNRESGLLGLSGISKDVRDLEARAQAGDAAATRALVVFAHRARRYVGAFIAVLGGVDAIVLTGGIGEHASRMRERILAGLERLGIVLDRDRNALLGSELDEGDIAAPGSAVRLLVIPTDEERRIAQESWRLRTELGSSA